MSPIKIEMEVAGNVLPMESEIPLGGIISLTDYNPNNPGVLFISDNGDGSGGLVYRRDAKDSISTMDRKFHVSNPDSGEVEAVIDRNSTTEVPLYSRMGKITLRLTHHD